MLAARPTSLNRPEFTESRFARHESRRNPALSLSSLSRFAGVHRQLGVHVSVNIRPVFMQRLRQNRHGQNLVRFFTRTKDVHFKGSSVIIAEI